MATTCWRSALGALVFLAALASASAATYTVGDAQGWDSGVNYATWAAQYKFNVGDVLVFSYSPMHGVVEVSAADYQSCNMAKPINVYTTGKDSVPLTKPSQYFICGTPGHCAGGMALEVSAAAVAATTPLASPPSPSAIPPSPSATTTPSPSASVTPAPSAVIPPAGATPPSTLGSPSLPLLGSPPAPPGPPAVSMDRSSSTMVLASSVLTVAAVAMVLG